MDGPVRRPRYSRCPEGQSFVPGTGGKLLPAHTPSLGARCRCASCRQAGRWTPEARAARSAEYRAKVADGVQFGTKGPKRIASRWLPEHEQTLVALLGTMDTASIADELTRRFGWPRTEIAVRERIKVRRLSRLTVRPWSQREVARVLGVGYEQVRGWVRRGWLTGTPWKLGGGQRPGAISQTFTVADIERLLRERPSLARVETVRHPSLRTLLMALSRRPAGHSYEAVS